MEEIVIDGACGEGGGQMVRTSLALSMLTGRPFRIHSVRARRVKPGLARQHLAAVQAAQKISDADVEGAHVGSREVRFAPRRIKPGRYHVDIGTAGNACLVFQTALPALMMQQEKTQLVIEGGTHNMKAPFFEFLDEAFLPVLRRIGFDVELTLQRHGFYPAGGGRISAVIRPAQGLKPVQLEARQEPPCLEAEAFVSRLPVEIALRELRVLKERFPLAAEKAVEIKDALSPANAVMIKAAQPGFTEVLIGHGRIGVRAEQVAETLARETRDYLNAAAPVGKYLADQLLLPLALGAGGTFLAAEITEHFKTNAFVMEKFLGPCISHARAGSAWRVDVLSVRAAAKK